MFKITVIVEIMKEVNRLKEDGMFEDSGSEYSPSDDSESSESSSDSDFKPLDQVKTPSRKNALPPNTPQRRRRGNLSNYVSQSRLSRCNCLLFDK